MRRGPATPEDDGPTHTAENELNARAAERSAILTDLVLLAIGVTSVFGVGLALAEYGRAQTLDPALIPYEGVSFNVAQWIAARSTDDILLASLGMSLALIAIYAVFRMLKLKAWPARAVTGAGASGDHRSRRRTLIPPRGGASGRVF